MRNSKVQGWIDCRSCSKILAVHPLHRSMVTVIRSQTSIWRGQFAFLGDGLGAACARHCKLYVCFVPRLRLDLAISFLCFS